MTRWTRRRSKGIRLLPISNSTWLLDYRNYSLTIAGKPAGYLTDWYFVTETQIFERLDRVVRHVSHYFRAAVEVAQRVAGKRFQKLFGQRHRQRFSAAYQQL